MTHRRDKIKQIISVLPLIAVSVFAACTGGNRAKSVLDAATAMMAEHPDSAYLLLTGSDSLFAGEDKALRMRHAVLTADAANKAYIPVTADSLLTVAAAYYDGNGDANERVRAHYLLGCAYRDRGDAAAALREYYEAVDRADTLSRDCDYKLMSYVYGQMSDVFNGQYLQHDAMKYQELYSAFALKAKDTLNWLLGKELQIPLYFALRDTAKVLTRSEEVAALYMKYGYVKEASRVYPSAINIYIGRGDYEKAKDLMDKFEYESDLYDEEGNITHRREQYYYTKGLYCLGVNRIDSAEMYFRLLPRYGYQYESCKGLLGVFRKRNNKDSILKYSSCLEGALEHELSKVLTKEVAEIAAKYELKNKLLTKHQKSTGEDSRSVNGFWIILPVAVLCAIVVLLIVRLRSVRANKDSSLNEAPSLTPCTLENDEVGMQTVLTSDILGRFRESCGGSKKIRISEKDWRLLFEEVRLRMPSFYGTLFNKQELSDIERKICVLVCLNFSSADITVILDSTPQSITNFKRKANKKMFGDDSARTLSRNLHGSPGLSA